MMLEILIITYEHYVITPKIMTWILELLNYNENSLAKIVVALN